MKKETTNEKLNLIIKCYCDLFYSILFESSNKWCLTNFKRKEISKLYDDFIKEDAENRLIFVNANKWLNEAFEKGSKDYLKNSCELLFEFINNIRGQG